MGFLLLSVVLKLVAFIATETADDMIGRRAERDGKICSNEVKV